MRFMRSIRVSERYFLSHHQSKYFGRIWPQNLYIQRSCVVGSSSLQLMNVKKWHKWLLVAICQPPTQLVHKQSISSCPKDKSGCAGLVFWGSKRQCQGLRTNKSNIAPKTLLMLVAENDRRYGYVSNQPGNTWHRIQKLCMGMSLNTPYNSSF